jgi:hypothetical protein
MAIPATKKQPTQQVAKYKLKVIKAAATPTEIPQTERVKISRVCRREWTAGKPASLRVSLLLIFEMSATISAAVIF